MEKPKLVKVWTYSVQGRGYFPTDMLRYDYAVAANTEAQLLIDAPTVEERLGARVVGLVGEVAPTVARWASFGWQVVGPVVPGKREKVGG